MKRVGTRALLVLAGAAFTARAGLADCDRAKDVRIELVGFAGPFNVPLRVDLTGGRSVNATPDPARSRWSLRLDKATEIEAIKVHPVVEGFLAAVSNRRLVREGAGRCIAELSFLVERAWSVAIEPLPEDWDQLTVQGRIAMPGTVESEFSRTGVVSLGPLAPQARVELTIVLGDTGTSYVYELTRDQLREAPLAHDTNEIARRICRQRGRTNAHSILTVHRQLRQRGLSSIRFALR
jgi:hypothetical protein